MVFQKWQISLLHWQTTHGAIENQPDKYKKLFKDFPEVHNIRLSPYCPFNLSGWKDRPVNIAVRNMGYI